MRFLLLLMLPAVVLALINTAAPSAPAPPSISELLKLIPEDFQKQIPSDWEGRIPADLHKNIPDDWAKYVPADLLQLIPVEFQTQNPADWKIKDQNTSRCPYAKYFTSGAAGGVPTAPGAPRVPPVPDFENNIPTDWKEQIPVNWQNFIPADWQKYIPSLVSKGFTLDIETLRQQMHKFSGESVPAKNEL